MTGKLYASFDARTVWWGADGKGHTMYLASGLPNAATALEHNLTLLTIDTDYDRVPHLKWQLVNLKKAASSQHENKNETYCSLYWFALGVPCVLYQ